MIKEKRMTDKSIDFLVILFFVLNPDKNGEFIRLLLLNLSEFVLNVNPKTKR